MSRDESPNWVAARAACTLEHCFKGLAERVRSDVRKFNGLTPATRRDRQFLVEDIDSGVAVVRARNVPDHRSRSGVTPVRDPDFETDCVRIEHGNGRITARRKPDFEMSVTPRWNDGTLTCDLFVDDVPVPVWKASARILEPYLFDDRTC